MQEDTRRRLGVAASPENRDKGASECSSGIFSSGCESPGIAPTVDLIALIMRASRIPAAVAPGKVIGFRGN